MTRIEEKKLVYDVIGSFYMSSHNGDIREGPLVQKMLESALGREHEIIISSREQRKAGSV